jgi:hypothetical protein
MQVHTVMEVMETPLPTALLSSSGSVRSVPTFSQVYNVMDAAKLIRSSGPPPLNMIRLSMIFATQVFIAVKFTAQVDSLRPEFDFWGLEKMSTAIVIRASGLPPLLLSTRDRPLLG